MTRTSELLQHLQYNPLSKLLRVNLGRCKHLWDQNDTSISKVNVMDLELVLIVMQLAPAIGYRDWTI